MPVELERNTQELLSKYVPAVDLSFVCLYGDQTSTEMVAKEVCVFYQKVSGKIACSYSMDHTASSYVFDPECHTHLFIRRGKVPDPIAHDLKLLLS